MPLFGSSKRARAAEDASDVTSLAELKSWVRFYRARADVESQGWGVLCG